MVRYPNCFASITQLKSANYNGTVTFAFDLPLEHTKILCEIVNGFDSWCSELRIGKTSILYFDCDMRHTIVIDFGYFHIVIWHTLSWF